MKTLNDLAAPAPVKRKLLEADIQRPCVDWARKRGYWARKFSSMTQNSVPDYLFARVLPGGKEVKFATEFKRPGNTSTEAQKKEQLAMREAGWDVFECDNFLEFTRVVAVYEECA